MDEDDDLVREKGRGLQRLGQRVDGGHLLIANERICARGGIGQEAAQDCLLGAADVVRFLPGEKVDLRRRALCERRHKLMSVHRR